MKEKALDLLVYELKKAWERNEPGAIVLLGAGCSITAGIPSAGQIVREVLRDHADHPGVKELLNQAQNKSEAGKEPSSLVQYADLMDCLGPNERNRLFDDYLSNSKINVSHIYLAQLVKEGFVDYILTPNFDNLAQRALALYNIFPPTYDLPNFETLTTQTLNPKSITYLHGTYNGLWQLNTKEEMNKVLSKGFVKDIFNKITSNRPWIVIGYSGDDAILEQLAALGRFNNGLNWVGYKDNPPTERVQKELLGKDNNGTTWLKGYDSDTFFLKLNVALGLSQPSIIAKPFSFLSELQGNIIDLQDEDEYKEVKQRLEERQKHVEDAIKRYELSDTAKKEMSEPDIHLSQLKLELIRILISKEYEKALGYENEVLNNDNPELLNYLAAIYNSWGNALADLAKTKSGAEAKELYKEAFERYGKAIKAKPDYSDAYYNWGVASHDLAKTQSGAEAEALYVQVFDKYGKAIEIKPDDAEAYNNWGNVLYEIANTKSGAEADTFYEQAIEKYGKAIEIKPDDAEVYYNWGIVLDELARAKSGAEAEALYLYAIEKYGKTIELKPDYFRAHFGWGNTLMGLAKTKTGAEAEALIHDAFGKYGNAIKIKPDFAEANNNWGSALHDLAKTKTGAEAETLYQHAIEKYVKAIEIKHDFSKTYGNWGNSLMALAKSKSGLEAKDLFEKAFQKLHRSVELGEHPYNLACCYALTGEKEKAFETLEKCLEQRSQDFDFVEKDSDWDNLREEDAYKNLKTRYGQQS